MPAINLTRLNRQVDELGNSFSQPGVFCRHLHELLDYYADRTLRPSSAGNRPPLLPHYTISESLLRVLETELARLSHLSSTLDILNLADALWAEGYFEFRLLSAFLLGQVPADGEEEVARRLQAWATPEQDRRILKALFQAGKASLGQSNPDGWLRQITTWLQSEAIPEQALGLRALRAVIADPQFVNLPKIYKLLTPVAASAPPELHPDLASVLAVLAQRSPAETLSFLKYLLKVATEPRITRLVRRCLPLFTEEEQKALRADLVKKAG